MFSLTCTYMRTLQEWYNIANMLCWGPPALFGIEAYRLAASIEAVYRWWCTDISKMWYTLYRLLNVKISNKYWLLHLKIWYAGFSTLPGVPPYVNGNVT